MSEIDWPEGAEAAIVANNRNRQEKRTYFIREYSVTGGAIVGKDVDGGKINALTDYWELIERPSSPAWNGEGRPPVGTVCEVSCGGNNFERCTIRYMGPELCVVDHDAPYRDQHYHLSSVVFRPIRTPEQIAAEEREKAVQEMVGSIHGGVVQCAIINGAYKHIKEACKDLYDAGYRKTEG